MALFNVKTPEGEHVTKTNDYREAVKAIEGTNNVIHYKADGYAEVMKVSKNIAEAIDTPIKHASTAS